MKYLKISPCGKLVVKVFVRDKLKYYFLEAFMIFKVYYQEHPERNPKRETTLSLYLTAESLPQAREIIEENTDYNVEFIEELSDKAVTYEKANPNFKMTTF